MSSPKNIPKSWKRVTHTSYVFGDFDGDGIANIDDPKPFDKKVKRPRVGKGHYHQSRYIDARGEVKLSTELRALKREADKHRPLLQSFLKSEPRAKGRIKSVPSIMKKLRERHFYSLGDIAGAKVAVDNYSQVPKTVKRIKKRHKTDKKEEDDYYKNPLDGYYYAHHLSLLGGGNRRMEVQVKTKRHDKLHAKAHGHYKKKTITKARKSKFTRRARRINELDKYFG